MKRKFFFVSLIVFLMIAGISCRKVQRPLPQPGQLNKATLENLTGIPKEYGNLVSVTAHAQYEGWAQLWFVDSLQTIRMVRVQFHYNRIHENVLLIPRN
jgi:hypothetical protein